MEPLIIYRQNDEQIIIRLYTDKTKQTLINIDDLQDLEVRMAIGKTITNKYNKAGGGGFTALTRIDAYNYYFWLVTDETYPLGRMDMWVEVYETNAELPDNIQNSIRMLAGTFELKSKPY